ncbi:hypothetical protein ACIBCT_19765 [Streptosporangium sp. NPDC050855]|uniref:hypothetical protein n=1 Tax=Streptosporangium sp. NPDC050855 TaxID=3366194 RepID=UPI0037A45497
MPPSSFDRHRFTVLAYCGQFYLQDLEAHGVWMRSHAEDDQHPPAGWTEEAVYVHRIGVQPHSIAIGTARSDMVETTLLFHPTAPMASLEEADHVVEADIELPTGDLAVYGPADGPGQERHVNVAAGRYRVRVSYTPSAPPASEHDDSEPGDHLHYRMDIWPTGSPAALAVLKQGQRLWAG